MLKRLSKRHMNRYRNYARYTYYRFETSRKVGTKFSLTCRVSRQNAGKQVNYHLQLSLSHVAPGLEATAVIRCILTHSSKLCLCVLTQAATLEV